MKNKENFRKGFTLIELLVVVLIIGILAAVALPQYRKAVWKSRLVQVISFINAVEKAEESYYLANQAYTHNLNDLDIDVTKNLTEKDGKLYLNDFEVGPISLSAHSDDGKTQNELVNLTYESNTDVFAIAVDQQPNRLEHHCRPKKEIYARCYGHTQTARVTKTKDTPACGANKDTRRF